MKHPPRIHAALFFMPIAVFFMSAGLYGYLYAETRALADQTMRSRAAVDAEEANLVQTKDLFELYQRTASSRTRLAEFFVPAKKAVTFIKTVESIGSSTGAAVSIASIAADPLETAAPGTIGKIVAHVEAGGSWTDVMRTLAMFEVLPYESSVDRISLSTSVIPGERASAARRWQMSFDVSAFMLATATDTAPTVSNP
jgi:hypothetical protein